MSKPILRLGGYRIDPATNGQAEVRVQWLNALSFKDVATGREVRVALPAGARFSNPDWSPDGRQLAFVMQEPAGQALWIAGADGRARMVARGINGAFGPGFAWTPDSRAVIARTVVADRGAPPVASSTPTGPVVQESSNRRSAARTYEDLLANAGDEALFDYYFTGQLARIDAATGAATPIGKAGLFTDFDVSPDGRYLLTERLKRPYSYLLPAESFPTEIAVWTIDGAPVKTIADRPLADDLPVDFDATVKGPREVGWRADAPATLAWAEALDGGDPKAKVPFHDRVLMQAAPFIAAPVELARTQARFGGVWWGDGGFAMVTDREWKTRTEHRYGVAPDRPGEEARLLLTRNYQDQYGDPGRPIREENAAGKPVMRFTPDHAGVFATGEGATKAGAYPFLAVMPVAGGAPARRWTAQAPYYEAVVSLLDAGGARILTRRESAASPPNYVIRTVASGKATPVTAFPDPAPAYARVMQRSIVYKRADGLPLSGTLYTPAGYDPKRDGPLPTLLWAYPAEFTDAAAAGQTVDQGNRFTRPRGISQLFMLTQGYAVLDNPAMPIIGANGAEPNDTYVAQLQADAQAAVDAVVALGVGDRDRMAVGGHSYGAFMTANLLAHTSLFRAGIARSGAYNRTLTPFGFQAEQRTYWQAEPTYTAMSPFTFADKITAPILLIHGGADDNSGTFPIQSERMYAALKGNGATVRYVVLPNEPHGYRALESTEETLWQMTDWLDRYVKPKRPAASALAAK